MWSVVAVAVPVAVVAVVAWRSSQRLQQRVDAERAATTGGVAALLNAPDARVRSERLRSRMLRNVSGDERAWYVRRWRQQQGRARTQPATAVLEADELLTRLLDDVG